MAKKKAMRMPMIRKGKRGGHSCFWRGRKWNLDTKDGAEAIRRRRDLMAGTWRPAGEPDALDATAGADLPPADPGNQSENPATSRADDGSDDPASTDSPDQPGEGASVAADINAEAEAVAGGTPEAEPQADAGGTPENPEAIRPAGVDLGAILKKLGFDQDAYEFAGHHTVGLTLAGTAYIPKMIYKVKAPPLPVPLDGHPTKCQCGTCEMGRLVLLIRGITDECAAQKWRDLIPNLAMLPAGIGCVLGCSILGTLQFFMARDLAGAIKAGTVRVVDGVPVAAAASPAPAAAAEPPKVVIRPADAAAEAVQIAEEPPPEATA